MENEITDTPDEDNSEFFEEDSLLPTEIVHNCEELRCDGTIDEYYNYLVYTFNIDGRIFTAKSYLDTISEVSVRPPEELGDLAIQPSDEIAYGRVLAYLRRRYTTIKRLGGGAGYVTIWQADDTFARGKNQSDP